MGPLPTRGVLDDDEGWPDSSGPLDQAHAGRSPVSHGCSAFAAMGGHGKDYTEVRYVSTRDYVSGRICTVRKGARLFDYPGGLVIGTLDPPRVRDYLGTDPSGDFTLISSDLEGTSRSAWVRSKAVSDIRPAEVPTPDCDAEIAAERERVKAAAIAAVEAL